MKPARRLLLCLVLALGGLEPAVAAEATVDCLTETFPTRQLRCLIEAAEVVGDPTLCLAAEEPGIRWMCVARVAEAAGVAAHCAVLPQEETVGPQGLGRELCRVHLAIAWQRPEFCAGLSTPNLADACYLQMVESGADRALCQRIENPILESACGGE
jgi:hypothetical protein